MWVGTRECGLVCVRVRDWRDPRLAPRWTGRSVRRRLPAHLTEQAGSAQISPGGHRYNDLPGQTRCWNGGRLAATGCACDAGPANTGTAAKLTHMIFGLRGRGRVTNAVCTQSCQELCTSQDVSPRRGRAGCRGTTPPMFCFALLAFSLLCFALLAFSLPPSG